MSQELSSEIPSKLSIFSTKLFSLPLWVVLSFFVAQLFSMLLVTGADYLGFDLGEMNQSVLMLILSALAYVFMIVFIIIVPRLVIKNTTSLKEIGINRLPSWTDILLSPAALIIYLLISVILSTIFAMIFPSIDLNQAQETGFNNLTQNYEYYLAFIALVILAPVAEEVIFRGYLYGKLKKYVPIWAAIIMTSVVFGAVHGAWNLAIDTFALSIIMCTLRELTGNIWSSILLHMTKNGIAYYFLFINTTLLTTLGG